MSKLFDRLKSYPAPEKINEEASPFSIEYTEGSYMLFFRGEEHADLMGHAVEFYSNGVLLTLKDKHKKYPDLEKSFIFYNNQGEKVFELSNIVSKWNPSVHLTDYFRPTKLIDVELRGKMIYVVETDVETKETEEYFVPIDNNNIETTNKFRRIYDIFEDDVTVDP